MKTNPHLSVLILLATSALLPAQEVPAPLYTVDLSKLISQELDINATGTLAFLTEHTLAVSMCRNLRCNLETLDLDGGRPRAIAKTDEVQNYSVLFRGPEGRVIMKGEIGTGSVCRSGNGPHRGNGWGTCRVVCGNAKSCSYRSHFNNAKSCSYDPLPRP